MRADMVAGLLFIALAIAIYSVNWQMSYPPMGGDPGSTVMPTAIAVCMGVLGALLAVRAAIAAMATRSLHQHQAPQVAAPAVARAVLWRTGCCATLSLLGYVLLLPYLGYFIATTLFFTGAAWILGSHGKRAIVGYLIGGLLVASVTYFALSKGLNILLPRGSLVILLEQLHA